MSGTTRIWSPVDYSKDGKQVDCLRLPISTDTSAYGWIPIPIIVLKNGDGPTAVLIAGTHGDEYEGQVALMRLSRQLQLHDLRGRVIMLPSLNFPAVRAGRRVSPIDEGNLNRVYPGHAHGTATEMIAHYVTEVLLPMADLVVDLHSGGRSLDYVPCALVRGGKTLSENRKLHDLLDVFGVPFAEFTDGTGGGGNTTLPAAAAQLGVPVITAELGGAATLRRAGSDLAEQGVLRLLKHLGMLPSCEVPAPGPVRLMNGDNMDLFLYADSDGIFEPMVDIGDEVDEGQLAGLLHSIEAPHSPPTEIVFVRRGMVAFKRHLALTVRGDCLCGLLEDVEPSPDIRR
ncbi:hypothetical protein B0G80_1304 [Paraburkholderia sp. BL6669N2]|uniref:succinylglutamate desuccinylase/aspartoacylase family protein n=1 Tax=Paraburkholderia sp. BL6669N2 TaxID=1938807 RepID=UPI000E27B3F3|nr:succinylglutamate desuccinylase/aspartoacylase family protein [Paraburkholderia sp. BL6669N2]REG58641.1 hypothetical protein B0G80_1304 [Paraburkholderia sp. BL6669N2]